MIWWMGGAVLAGSLVNACLLHTRWYQRRYADVIRFGGLRQDRQLDVVTLGSTQAVHGFDYAKTMLKGANLAVAPQPLRYDNLIWKHYRKNIKKTGWVILTICPFSSIWLDFDSKLTPDIYYHILAGTEIADDCRRKRWKLEMQRLFPLYTCARHPSLFFNLICAKSRTHAPDLKQVSLTQDAEKWMAGWRKQFHLTAGSAGLSPENQNAFQKNVEILCDLIRSIKAYGATPVLVIPPVSAPLKNLLTNEILVIYLYKFIENVTRNDPTLVLDYCQNETLQDEQLYLNALCLNQHGRALLTQVVLKDLADDNRR